MRLYRYIGPKEIAERTRLNAVGTAVCSSGDILDWIERSDQGRVCEECLTATFVVDDAGQLRIADRHSEHVACVGGGPVQSAGEITFAVEDRTVRTIRVSNQSTGYCPEPESWPAVQAALAACGIAGPSEFDPTCTFRRCRKCSSINLVKDQFFSCALCGADLPSVYNCQPE